MLPQELIDTIIGLVPNLPFLASCSLVCQAFLPNSRACIFRHVSLNKAKCPLFLKLCKASPHIPSLVKSISVSFQSRSVDAESSGISEVMNYLSGVERVEVCNYSLRDMQSDGWDELTKRTLHTFVMRHMRNMDVNDLYCLLDSSRNCLQNLEIHETDFHLVSLDGIPPRLHIRTLLLHGTSLLNTLSDTSICPLVLSDVFSLNLMLSKLADFLHIRSALTSGKLSSLTELTILHPSWSVCIDLTLDAQHTLPVSQLRTLSITFCDYRIPLNADFHLMNWWIRNLTENAIPNLEHVTIHILFDRFAYAFRELHDHTVWTRFDAALAHPSVRLSVYLHDDEVTSVEDSTDWIIPLKKEIEQQMKVLNDRGAVQVYICGWYDDM
ncbi:hypothetical protein EDD85DRAFT_1027493 [Armillaria nabsnona]|nr:hypothetical protein EDD85DRAFT_1027493 [Armillaria nabsnona]